MSEYTDSLRALADYLDQSPGHDFRPSEAFSALTVYVDTREQLATVSGVIAQCDDVLPPLPDGYYTYFRKQFGPLEFNVAARLSLASAGVGK